MTSGKNESMSPVNEIPWDIFGQSRREKKHGTVHGLTRRPGDSNVTDSLFKETGLLSSPAFFRAALAQAICFILKWGLKMLFFFKASQVR